MYIVYFSLLLIVLFFVFAVSQRPELTVDEGGDGCPKCGSTDPEITQKSPMEAKAFSYDFIGRPRGGRASVDIRFKSTFLCSNCELT